MVYITRAGLRTLHTCWASKLFAHYLCVCCRTLGSQHPSQQRLLRCLWRRERRRLWGPSSHPPAPELSHTGTLLVQWLDSQETIVCVHFFGYFAMSSFGMS